MKSPCVYSDAGGVFHFGIDRGSPARSHAIWTACPSVRAGTNRGRWDLFISGIVSPEEGQRMPAWLEILLNVIAFCRVHRHRKISQGARRKIAGQLGIALIGLVRLAGRPDQLVSLDQNVPGFGLRPERKADDDERKAEQQSDYHHASVGWFVRVVK